LSTGPVPALAVSFVRFREGPTAIEVVGAIGISGVVLIRSKRAPRLASVG
jgi:drug/metabolite transporter (DMT)-like permease